MPTPEIYLGFGSTVALAGIAMVYFHVRSHRNEHLEDGMCEADQRFFALRYSRRIQTSALTVTIGALISLSGYLRVFESGASPVFATIYVVGLLLLSLWLVLMALSDALASRVYASRQDRRNRKMHKSLEETLAEVRQAHGLDAQAD